MNNGTILKLINDQIAALEAIRAEIQRPTVPTPEMVSIPAPPGGEYAVMETDNLCAVTAFSIGRCPVTQGQWAAVMGGNPSHFRGDPRLPIENVSWHEATAFCERLSDAHGLTGTDRYRLPTEAEWEWAASGGIREDRRVTDDTGWYVSNAGNRTHPVGEKEPNGFGLHDTLGSVWEWTATEEGSSRVVRGGCWNDDPARARVANRAGLEPSYRLRSLGFRLARGGK